MKAISAKKIYLPLILFAGASFALIFLTILPLIKGIKEDSQQLLLEKEAQVNFSEEIKNIEEFEETYHKIEPDLKRMDSLFVDSGVPIIKSINLLEKSASDSNVLMEISSVSSDEKTGPWPFLIFNFQANASFSNLSRFIERLENNLYLIEIQSISIKRAVGEAGNVSASISLKIFTK